jgi:serine/threonine protein kinase
VALSPGTRLGPYEIQTPLGAGGMGEVYKARDTRLDRTVAIKVLPEHVATDPDLKQRFEREAKTISSLNHPHICTIHDVGSQDGIDFLVMEHLEGETLAQRLTKGALPLDQALQVAIQIADALDKAHRQGIVHRDLKPGNIMLTTTGAKLLDFGLAKLMAPRSGVGLTSMPTQSAGLTGEGKILGTLQYMAPEQVEGQEADARTDIFAFGAVVYEMVTGTKAFEGKRRYQITSQIDVGGMGEVYRARDTKLDRYVAIKAR